MKIPYDALLFDMDGVLVDVSNSYRKTIQRTASIFLNREVATSEVSSIKKIVGMNNDWDATYALIGDAKLNYVKVKETFQDIYLGKGKTKGLIDQESLLIAKETLVLLREKYRKMGIATGRPVQEAQYVLDRFALNGLFDVLIGKEDVKREKPFPDPILKAIRSVRADNAVYIGDSPSDVVAADAAGIPSIYVGDLEIGTIRFESMSQVIDYLL